jgi:hypothetical protein
MSVFMSILLIWISFNLLFAAQLIWRRVIVMPRGSNRVSPRLLRVIDHTA